VTRSEPSPPPRTRAEPDAGPASAGGVRRVLVTGGAGFIGSHLTDRLLARGDHVTVVDNLSTGRRANLPGTHERLRFIEADLSDALHALGRGETFHEVYHLAAAVGVQLVMADPIRAIETNVEQTAALLRFAVSRAPGGGPAPVLIASSSEVYGKSVRSPFHEDDDAVYGPTVVGRWSYACTKAVDEYLGLAYHRRHRMPAVVARLFNTVGPRQVGDYGMVLPRFVSAALAGRPLTVYGDGTQSRCFCDVRDVVEVLPRMLASPACHGRVFNVGSDRPVTIAALADLVVRTLSSRSEKRFIPYSEAYPPGFEDLVGRQPDIGRLRQTVGFEPRIPLERTIADLAAAMRAAGEAA
jgi:UDP-glucose 4-epimerase